MNKYLFLVNESESANGVCTFAVMKELVHKGNRVFCVTNREYGSPSTYLHEGINYITVQPRITSRIQSLLYHKKEIKPICKLFFSYAFNISNKVSLAHSLFSWPLISPIYAHNIYSRALSICKREDIDIIVPVYSQIDTLIAANKIKRRMHAIKVVPYFLDSLSGGYGPKVFSTDQCINRGLKWERKLLDNADEIIVMESSRSHHLRYSSNESYYDKFVFLDLPLLTEHEYKSSDKVVLFDSNKINLVYIGTFLEGVRSPDYFLKVFSYLQGDEWQLYFIGTTNCQSINSAALKDNRIHVLDRCSHDDALSYISQATIVLNFGNTIKYMTPSKIFEYMSFCKPIITTMPIQDEPSAVYLRRYPQALLLDESDKRYNIQAERIYDFQKTVSNSSVIDLDIVCNLYHNNTPEATVDVLQSILTNHC